MAKLDKVATPILLERIRGALGVLDGHVHMAKLEANMNNWGELEKTLELIGSTFDNADEIFGELQARRRKKT